jgi:hypothetical protein
VNQTTVIDHDDYQTQRPEPGTRLAKITDSIDRDRAGHLAIAGTGGAQFGNMLEVMEFAKLMSTAGEAIQPYLRQNPGACLAVTMQAIEWKMSPFAVANKVYFVNGRIGHEAQLINAVINARAPLERRIDVVFIGEGPERQCKVTGIFRGEDTPREYLSPKVKDIKIKNSPLWTNDPDQQLFYFSTRSWARRWCSDVILGVYTPEELREIEPDPRDAPPSDNVLTRLAAKQIEGEPVIHKEGFRADNVDRGIATPAPKNDEVEKTAVEMPDMPESLKRAPKAEGPKPGELSTAQSADQGPTDDAPGASEVLAAEQPSGEVVWTETGEEERIDTSDIPEAGPEFFENATLVRPGEKLADALAREAQGSDKTPPADPTPPPAENNAQASPAAEPEPAPEPAGEPTNSDTYVAHMMAIINAPGTTREKFEAVMRAEKGLRKKIRVSGQALETIYSAFDDKFNK